MKEAPINRGVSPRFYGHIAICSGGLGAILFCDVAILKDYPSTGLYHHSGDVVFTVQKSAVNNSVSRNLDLLPKRCPRRTGDKAPRLIGSEAPIICVR